MTERQLIFLPYYRRQFPIAIPSAGQSSHLTGSLKFTLTNRSDADAEPSPDDISELIEHPITFTGPGDIERINPQVISRMEPPPDTNDFEPNYFPFIEFRDPDFPWRYSLDVNTDSGIQPWLALIVLSKEELERMTSILSDLSPDKSLIGRTTNGVTCLNIPYNEKTKDLFPSPDWSTAHVQIEDDGSLGLSSEGSAPNAEDSNLIHAYIENFPDRHAARLFCFRKLSPSTSYTAFLAPAYQAGAKAGNDNVLTDPLNALVFSAALDTVITLPIYYSWPFMTSEKGDFESLARELKPVESPGEMGTRVVDTSLNFPESSIAKRYFRREGALAEPGFETKRQGYVDQLKAQRNTRDVLQSLNLGLESVSEHFNSGASTENEQEDPLISMPYYGRYFQKSGSLPEPADNDWREPEIWIEELNLDYRNRIAAGLGTRTVQKNQEDYAKRCWYQVGEIRLANEKLRQAQAGLQLAEKMKAKHLDPLTDERFTMFTAAFHSHFAVKDQGESSSLKMFLDQSGLSKGLVRPVFKRIAHQRIGLDRVDLFEPWRLATLQVSFWKQLPCKILSFFLRLFTWLFYLFPGSPIFQRLFDRIWTFLRWLKKYYSHIFPCLNNRVPNRPFTLYDRVKNDLRISIYQAAGNIFPPKKEIIPVTPMDIAADFRPKFNPAAVMRRKVKAIIRFNDQRTISDNLDPIMDIPRLDDAMYQPLKDFSLDYILPGLEKLPQNSITLAEENRRFIESYLVGVNHEMGRELVWRLFPTDQRGTIFSYFWDPTRYETSSSPDGAIPDEALQAPLRDISNIHDWDMELGENRPHTQAFGSGQSEQNRIVLVIKGDLIRRYPDTLFFAVKLTRRPAGDAEDLYWQSDTDREETTILPTFRAQIGTDALAIGFPFSLDDLRDQNSQYYFVLQENQDLPRWGLDIKSRSTRVSGNSSGQSGNGDPAWSDVGVDQAGMYVRDWSGLSASGSDTPAVSAEIARLTLQMPIQLVIHASQMLKESQL